MPYKSHFPHTQYPLRLGRISDPSNANLTCLIVGFARGPEPLHFNAALLGPSTFCMDTLKIGASLTAQCLSPVHLKSPLSACGSSALPNHTCSSQRLGEVMAQSILPNGQSHTSFLKLHDIFLYIYIQGDYSYSYGTQR